MDAQEPLLPNVRSIPIRGDVVRTKRILSDWVTPQALAQKLKLSVKRLSEIEAGGESVYAVTLISIAKAFGVHWKELVDEGRLAAVTQSRSSPKKEARSPEKKVLSVIINFHNINEFNEDKIEELMNLLKGISGLQADITVERVDEGSTQIYITQSEADTIRLASAFSQGKADPLGFIALKLKGGVLALLVACVNYIEFQNANTVAREEGDFATFCKRNSRTAHPRGYHYEKSKALVDAAFGTSVRFPDSLPRGADIFVEKFAYHANLMYEALSNKEAKTELHVGENGLLTIIRIGIQAGELPEL